MIGSKCNIKLLFVIFNIMEPITVFWPPFLEGKERFHLNEYYILDQVAKQYTQSPRPKYHHVTPRQLPNPEYVVKNVFGGVNRLLHQPKQPIIINGISLPITHATLMMISPPQSDVWISQEYIPFLAHIGHWSVYCVSGEIMEVLFVCPGSTDVIQGCNTSTLLELQ